MIIGVDDMKRGEDNSNGLDYFKIVSFNEHGE